MPRSLTTQAIRDLADDIAYHAMAVTHAAFDFACVVAVALLVVATGIDANAVAERPLPDAQASMIGPPAPTCAPNPDKLAAPDRDCITAVVLSALDA